MTTEPRQRFAGAALPWITAVGGAALVMVIWFGVTFHDASRPPGEFVAPEPTVIAENDVPAAEPELMLHPGTRIAWPRLGAPWQDYPSSAEWRRTELHNQVGQMIAIDDDWIAPFVGGQLNEDVVAYKGPDSLRKTADAFQKHTIGLYYDSVSGIKTGKGTYHRYDFDGHEGLVAQYRVTWKNDIAGDKGEVQVVAVIDVDGDRAVVLNLALPDSQADQFMVVMDALLDARFLD